MNRYLAHERKNMNIFPTQAHSRLHYVCISFDLLDQRKGGYLYIVARRHSYFLLLLSLGKKVNFFVTIAQPRRLLGPECLIPSPYVVGALYPSFCLVLRCRLKD